MCSVKGIKNLNFENSYSKICSILKKTETEMVTLTGGEPTIHPDILKIAEKINEMDFRGFIASTNGVRFSDNSFTQKMVDFGMDAAMVSIHGTEDVSFEVTGKRSYKKKIKGIKNLLRHGVRVRIVSILMKPNVDDLPVLYDRLSNLGDLSFNILNLNYDGRAEKNIESLAVSFSQKYDFFAQNKNMFKKFTSGQISEFPRCLVPESLPKKISYLSTFDKIMSNEFSGGLNSFSNRDRYKKPAICSTCVHEEYCFGVKKKDLEIFGINNFKETVSDSGFIL